MTVTLYSWAVNTASFNPTQGLSIYPHSVPGIGEGLFDPEGITYISLGGVLIDIVGVGDPLAGVVIVLIDAEEVGELCIEGEASNS